MHICLLSLPNQTIHLEHLQNDFPHLKFTVFDCQIHELTQEDLETIDFIIALYELAPADANKLATFNIPFNYLPISSFDMLHTIQLVENLANSEVYFVINAQHQDFFTPIVAKMNLAIKTYYYRDLDEVNKIMRLAQTKQALFITDSIIFKLFKLTDFNVMPLSISIKTLYHLIVNAEKMYQAYRFQEQRAKVIQQLASYYQEDILIMNNKRQVIAHNMSHTHLEEVTSIIKTYLQSHLSLPDNAKFQEEGRLFLMHNEEINGEKFYYWIISKVNNDNEAFPYKYPFYWVNQDKISLDPAIQFVLKKWQQRPLNQLNFLHKIHQDAIIFLGQDSLYAKETLFYYAKNQRKFAPALILIDMATISDYQLIWELRKSQLYQGQKLLLLIENVEVADPKKFQLLKQLLIDEELKQYYKLIFYVRQDKCTCEKLQEIKSVFDCFQLEATSLQGHSAQAKAIKNLFTSLINYYNPKFSKMITNIDTHTINLLQQFPWHNHLNYLHNIIRDLVYFNVGNKLDPQFVQQKLYTYLSRIQPTQQMTMLEHQQSILKQLLAKNKGKIKDTCQQLQITRNTFKKLMA